MRELHVTVMSDKFIRGWHGDLDASGAPTGRGDAGEPKPLCEIPTTDAAVALEQTYKTDAHLLPYHVRDEHGEVQNPIHRLNTGALSVLRRHDEDVWFDIAFLDIDDRATHRTTRCARPEWRVEQGDRISQLPAELSPAGMYTTRGGYRLLFILPESLIAEEYIRWLLALNRELVKWGIVADELKDWTRCYRLPRVNRDGTQTEPELIRFDWTKVCTWTPTAEFVDCGGQLLELAAPANAPSREPASKGRRPALKPVAGTQGAAIGENRNDALFRRGLKFMRNGHDAVETLEFLNAENLACCSPPLEDSEIAQIARSVQRYAPTAVGHAQSAAPHQGGADGSRLPRPQHRDDALFADDSHATFAKVVLARLEGTGTEMVSDAKVMRKYDAVTGIWSEVEAETLRMRFIELDGGWIYKGEGKDGGPRFAQLRIRDREIDSVIRVAHTLRNKTGWLKTAPRLLAFSNGVVSISTNGAVELLPFAPEHKLLWTQPFPFLLPEADEPRRFRKFLLDVLDPLPDREDVLEVIREFVGLCLVGRISTFEATLMLVGDGANGKSTFLEIVQALFRKEDVAHVAPHDMSREYDRAELENARLNVVSEMPEHEIFDTTAFKAIVSGEGIKGRQIYCKIKNFEPKAGHIFAANNLPPVRDQSPAFWRRWLVVAFKRVFGVNERVKGLAAAIIAEELAQIAAWAVEGAANVIRRGQFDVPLSMTKALNGWRTDSDQVALFLKARCEPNEFGPGQTGIQANALYALFKAWADDTGHAGMTDTAFGRRMGLLGHPAKNCKGGHFYPFRVLATRR